MCDCEGAGVGSTRSRLCLQNTFRADVWQHLAAPRPVKSALDPPRASKLQAKLKLAMAALAQASPALLASDLGQPGPSETCRPLDSAETARAARKILRIQLHSFQL